MNFKVLIESLFPIAILMGFFVVGILLGNGTMHSLVQKTFSEPEDICGEENQSMESAAVCLQKEVATFYNYNISNVMRLDMTSEELRAEGGVCHHYAAWYCDRAIDLGFDCKKVTISSGDVLHRFAVMSSDEGYCLLDQVLSPKCHALAQGVIEDAVG